MKKVIILVLVFLVSGIAFAGERPCIFDFYTNVQEYLRYMSTFKGSNFSEDIRYFLEIGQERWGFEYSRRTNSLVIFDNAQDIKSVNGDFLNSVDLSNEELVKEFELTVISNFKETRDEMVAFRLNSFEMKEELISGFTGDEIITSIRLHFDVVLRNHITKDIRMLDNQTIAYAL